MAYKQQGLPWYRIGAFAQKVRDLAGTMTPEEIAAELGAEVKYVVSTLADIERRRTWNRQLRDGTCRINMLYRGLTTEAIAADREQYAVSRGWR